MKNVYEGRDFSILVSNEQKGLNYLIHVKNKDSNGILAAIGRPLRPHGAVPDREPELDAGEGINPFAKWGKRSHSVDVSSCSIVIFQCRDNRNDSDPSPFVHFVYRTTILEIKRRNPNPSPIGMMFGFLGFGQTVRKA